MKVIIVGGVAGGASTAARLRRLDEKVEILMLERGPDISFANCGLPYHIGKVIKQRDNLTLVTPEYFKQALNVDVRIMSEAVKVDRNKKHVLIKDHINGNEYEEKYDKLVLSPGAFPLRPNIPGINDSRIFTLRNLVDMDRIIKFVEENPVKKAAVIGAGFIGLEMAENLMHLGLGVSVIELADQVMPNIDYEMATFIHQHLKAKNIELILNDGVKEFKGQKSDIKITLQSNNSLNADLVIFSIGVRPETHLAKEAGLAISKLGAIKIDSQLKTSDDDIYALGDATEITHIVSGKKMLIPLANSANKQGRLVAENILGGYKQYKGTTAAAIAKVFDLTVASVGVNESVLKNEGIKYENVFLLPSSHSGYYPDAHPMIFKLIYNPETQKILGSQIIGVEGVDKRIDVISSMLQNKRTVQDLAELELAYAPPYSSAKDPVNLAGMIAVNQINGLNPVISIEEAEREVKKGAILLDVRSRIQYQLGKIGNSINIPLEELRNRVNELPKDKKIIVYCVQGKMAYFAVCILMNLGYKKVYNLNGGYKVYHSLVQIQENKGIFDNDYIRANDDVSAIPGKITETSSSCFIKIDACGLQCPGPILKLAESIEKAKENDLVELVTTDQGFKNDIQVWCERTGNKLVSLNEEKGKIFAQIQKGQAQIQAITSSIPNDKTIIVFSKDLDKAIASFIIATGAAAMNRKVTMFFTFWGLNILRKPKSSKVKKSLMEKMFGKMMPKGSKKLSLSQMNMMGMGAKMIRYIMKSKNVDSLETLIKTALEHKIRLVACQMSMDVMGIKKEELIDGVEIGGVASYLGAAEMADTNLFI